MKKNKRTVAKTTELAKPKERTETRIVFVEAGSTGLKEYDGFVNEAYLSTYTWPSVASIYSRLIRSDPEILMIGNAFSAWGRNTNIIIDLPDKPTDQEKKYHEFVYEVFDDVEGGMSALVESIVRKVPFYGWYVWNVPFAKRNKSWTPPSYKDGDGKSWKDEWRSQYDDGRIGFRRFSPRDVSTLSSWEFDGAKRATAMWQQDFPRQSVKLKLKECLHLVYGDTNNPEGMSPLEGVARLADVKRNYEAIMGTGSEHVAGYLNVNKTTPGSLTDSDKRNVADAARFVLSAQEGNYALWPYGMSGEVKDIPFAAASAILETIKYYSVAKLAIYMMQFIAYNIFTRTGALSSATDSSQIAVFTFNAMMDGFASQLDEQIGRRLYEINKESFPGLTRRPKMRFKHVEKNVALSEMGVFFAQMNGILPLGDEDYRAIRERSGFLPKNLPEVVKVPTRSTEPLNRVGVQKPKENDPANEIVEESLRKLEALTAEHDATLHEMLTR